MPYRNTPSGVEILVRNFITDIKRACPEVISHWEPGRIPSQMPNAAQRLESLAEAAGYEPLCHYDLCNMTGRYEKPGRRSFVINCMSYFQARPSLVCVFRFWRASYQSILEMMHHVHTDTRVKCKILYVPDDGDLIDTLEGLPVTEEIIDSSREESKPYQQAYEQVMQGTPKLDASCMIEGIAGTNIYGEG